MKCPWMPVTVHKSERYSDFGRIPAKDITTFDEWLKGECPFYQKPEEFDKPSVSGVLMHYTINEGCYRTTLADTGKIKQEAAI